jgi:hypothetical protein
MLSDLRKLLLRRQRETRRQDRIRRLLEQSEADQNGHQMVLRKPSPIGQE